MKTNLIAAFVSICLIVLLSSGCSKNESATDPQVPGTASGTITFTLNGAGFTNRVFSLSNSLGGFSTVDNMSAVVGSSMTATDTIWLAMAFPGSTTGTFPFTDSCGVVISMGQTVSRGFVSGLGNGQIAVTGYGAVSGAITGTFSGKLYEATLTGMDSVTVSGASFSAVRLPNE